ncbi:hypothetical protein AEAC466_02815 [Asticcacaulis sp. AC466]|uniref:cell wall hydrolase n=1 Tax=Asticcacaulis sp. AC466 TaxID=1282362 RepID=UPI0003C3DAD5|nr:cell wall hydrolase [Asticcacaulis sp. AC466]ESQ86140.1 hypothetical protein AEAC466_02815 [Asticcacaulis sp. AC466]
MASTLIARYRMRALMAASSVGLLIGASIGAACLGSHMARDGSRRADAARLMMASRDGTINTAALDASGGQIDQSAWNISMRFSEFGGHGTGNSALAQNLTTMRISDDVREQKGLPDGASIVRASLSTAPVDPLPGSPLSVHAAAAMNFKAATRSDADCLTQAIYYEARGEGSDGMRAVAQVILNRVRHPAYPKSICGVVYQGLRQATCQFSFVCNGAMSAPVERWAWRRAQQVADAALGGYVMKTIGTATSFHTTGVNPGWSGTMERVTQIGTHIFYQFHGRGARIANNADGVTPSSEVPQSRAPVATPTEIKADVQTTALLNTLSRAQANALPAATSTRPVQVAAQIHGRSAQDIVAEVALPAQKPTPAAVADNAMPKGISQ